MKHPIVRGLEREFSEIEHEVLECVEEGGPWPFITRRVFRDRDQKTRVWNSRRHRKQLQNLCLAEEEEVTEKLEKVAGTLWRCLWAPGDLNWWIGSIFALGSLLFALGSILSLSPALAAALSLSGTGVSAVFFLGSIPFTTAAYLQLYQSANVPPFHPGWRLVMPRRHAIFGWAPRNVGWLSCAFQFVGTLLFNLNTFDGLYAGLSLRAQDLLVWTPNVLGSILFLASGYLAFIETCHAHWAWKPASLSWWVTWINLLGCLGFMISACLALPEAQAGELGVLATVFTLQGAVCFFLGAVLMLPEAVVAE